MLLVEVEKVNGIAKTKFTEGQNKACVSVECSQFDLFTFPLRFIYVWMIMWLYGLIMYG